MTITAEQLDELERKAKAARRPGGWQFDDDNYTPEGCAHIAANSPDVTLVMVGQIRDLDLRLSIATESNVNDRKLIASLESQLAASRDIIRHFEQERDSWPAAYRERAKRTDARIEELEGALRHCDALAFTGRQTAVARGDDDGSKRRAFFRDISDTVRAVLPSEET